MRLQSEECKNKRLLFALMIMANANNNLMSLGLDLYSNKVSSPNYTTFCIRIWNDKSYAQLIKSQT